ncbi:MAG: serine/threonine-protein kinase, partial [Planctomycetota bacterium]
MSANGDRLEDSRVDQQRSLDRFCDEIEDAWKNGMEPVFTYFIDQCSPHQRFDFIYEIVNTDLEVNKLKIDQAVRSRYLNRIESTHHSIVHEIFDDLERSSSQEQTLSSTNGSEPVCYLGQQIGGYRIEKRIGGGGFGVVYLGRDGFLPRQVVIKVPIFYGHFGDEEVDKFLDEARNTVILNHPNILSVLHVGFDEDHDIPYIIQDYIPGGDLKSRIERKPMDVHQVLRLIIEIARAIGYAHERRVIHRDIKPANILITEDGRPIVADFGLSLFGPRLSRPVGEMVGTIRYMSPEQIRGESHRLDGRTDIWSIGVMLYYMLTGAFPFEGQDTQGISEAILFGRPIPLRQLR